MIKINLRSVSAKSIYADTAISLIFILVFVRYTLVNLVLQAFISISFLSSIVMPAFYFVVGFLTILSIKKIRRILHPLDILLPIVFIFIWLLSYFNNKNTEYMNDFIFQVFLVNLPLYYIGLSIDFNNDFKIFRKKMSFQSLIINLSILSLFVSILYQLYYANSSRTSEYAISQASTAILPSICIIVYYAIKEMRIYQISLAIIGIFHLLTIGIRLPLLCVGIEIILCALNKENKKVRIVLFFLAGFAAVIGLGGFEILMNTLYNTTLKLGVTTRFFDYFLRGDIMTLNFREDFIAGGIRAIKNSPILGNGVFGDRYYCQGGYSHNIFVELCSHYGMILGTVVILLLSVLFIKCLIKSSQNSFFNCMLMVLFCSVIVNLLLSGSYIEDSKFFLTVGLFIQFNRRTRKFPAKIL